MLLRSISKHVKDQNWFAVFLDFIIVVFGVFIGIQVANWNEARASYQRETLLLHELKREVEKSVVISKHYIRTYKQVADAGKRSLEFIANKTQNPCEDNCWSIIVDFMHASQWQDVTIRYSNYKNMRSLGFPKSSAIIDAMESYLAQNDTNAITLKNFPKYRPTGRQIIPINVAEFYWAHCYSLVNGIEYYVLDCPKGISDDKALKIVEEIISNKNIKPYLTDWAGHIVSVPDTIINQNISAQLVIDSIDAELKNR